MPENTQQSCALKKQKLFKGNKHSSLHLGRNYIFPHNICFSRLTVFLERRSRKNDRSSEQIVSTDKYPWLFSRQRKVIVYSFTPTLANSYLMSYERECARRKILRHQTFCGFCFYFLHARPSSLIFFIFIRSNCWPIGSCVISFSRCLANNNKSPFFCCEGLVQLRISFFDKDSHKFQY